MKMHIGRLAAAVMLGLIVWASVAEAEDLVTVRGNEFLRDGKPWIAEGVTLVGLVGPEGKLGQAYATAREEFGVARLNEVKEFGADLIRFQVSQAGLDPTSPTYDPVYRQQAIDAVKLARSKGFAVIVCMQWQSPAGDAEQENMPSDVTRRAWASIVGAFAKDKGVMLELFNEPHLKKGTAENWKVWQSTMQGLIDEVRALGSENVLLVDGLRSAKLLGGAPSLSDPLKQTGYAVHPFLVRMNRQRKQWERNWGEFARTHAVMATAFNALSNRPAQCSPGTPNNVADLFRYLRERRIGLVIWAFDLPGVRRGGRLTNFENFKCGPGTLRGAGQAVSDYFRAH